MNRLELIDKFFQFFLEKDHLLLPSSSLLPQNDETLFTTSGMQPLMPFFRMESLPPSKRLLSLQPCLRTTDIESVGKSDRHLTYFEMLGNFSLGDYFREEMIRWSYEFIVSILGIPHEKLYVSVFGGDERLGLGVDRESYSIWQELGFSGERIILLGRKDNFWQPGPSGPSGPCTEIYFDRGGGCGEKECKPGCECDRFLEFWNIVLTQYEITSSDTLSPLNKRNVDTGLGVERLLLILNEEKSVFDVETLGLVRQGLPDNQSSRIFCDHLRSVTYLIEEGVRPSNEGRGYVLRRLLRRLLFHSDILGVSDFRERVSLLVDDEQEVTRVIESERTLFSKTLLRGEKELNKLLIRTPLPSGKDIYYLHQTYGLPIWLSVDMLSLRGIEIDERSIETEKEEHKKRSQKKKERISGS